MGRAGRSAAANRSNVYFVFMLQPFEYIRPGSLFLGKSNKIYYFISHKQIGIKLKWYSIIIKLGDRKRAPQRIVCLNGLTLVKIIRVDLWMP